MTIPIAPAIPPEAKSTAQIMTNASTIRKALNSGAAGFVAKHASDSELVDAIRKVAAGSRYVDPELGGDLVVSDAAALTEALAELERDVLFLLALGYTNQEVAAQLYISVRTVDTHRAHVMQKAAVANARSSSSTRWRTG